VAADQSSFSDEACNSASRPGCPGNVAATIRARQPLREIRTFERERKKERERERVRERDRERERGEGSRNGRLIGAG